MIRLIIKNTSNGSSIVPHPRKESHLLKKDASLDFICADESEFRKYVEILEKLIKKNSIQLLLNVASSVAAVSSGSPCP